MGRNLDEIMKTLPRSRQDKINARAVKLLAEYETLQALRQALNVTQEEMARELGVKQESVSRLEQRSDMLLSTLARAIAVLGGKLDLTVHFRGMPSVSLAKLIDAAASPPSRTKPRPTARKAATPRASKRTRVTPLA